MVIELRDTSIADSTVFCPVGSDHATRVTQAKHIALSLALPLVVIRDLFDGTMVFARVLGQEPRVLLVGHQQTHPHDQVHHQEGVVSLGQDLPGHGDALQDNQSGVKITYINNQSEVLRHKKGK